MWDKGNTPALLVGVQTCTATLTINMVLLRKLGINLPQDPVIPLLGIKPRYQGFSFIPQGHLLNCVHSNFICNSQKLETVSGY